MIGSLITRGLVYVPHLQLAFGYAYPAYECYKTVEKNKPDIDQLRFWCQYWILVAGLTVCERIGDTFIGWVPMYGEAKLAFFIYLWFPKTKGTTYVYDSFFKPYVAKHETEIDRNLLELRLRAGDMVILYWQKAASYGQTRVFDILQYIASQSSPPRPTQPQQQQGTGVQKPTTVPPNRTPAATATQTQIGEPSSHASDASSSNQQEKTAEEEEAGPTVDSKATLNEQKSTPTLSIIESKKSSTSSEVQEMQIDSVPNGNTEAPPQQDIFLEEAVRVTRARSRRTRGGGGGGGGGGAPSNR